ncbi:hypothetical protein COV49_04605 [Candidatus Falkowbacteria bacterium CG11_big_fil_rev_8_21_14_0_20_39_10]|uniref:Glycosyl transferase family 1 n=1 Tax=Candidatus Falkowbacteria bacterium CG11_big_fil_rev_8_21_14_0_20_39_10 TaxID=1974570 RepID=A0A2M6K816_9BACT|nr:MAG: hypothetical protein COV49_04605 [Candidatus Falkowbacteria bacterium CG11_big_fil_rev_8_21_14_0_20_39_10]
MKKTILYLITQSELGGAQRYCFDLAKNLKNEFNIIVASGLPRRSLELFGTKAGEQGDKGELGKILEKENIKFYFLKNLKRSISPVNDFLALIQIIKLIKTAKPDIIHLNSSKISILGSLSSAFIRIFAIRNIRIHSRISIIYTAHGWVFNEPLSLWKKFFYKYAEKFTSPFKDKIICVSEYDRQTAIENKIAPAKKLITIHNGLAPINFLPRNEARAKLNSKFKIQNSKLIIGSIGNLYKTKGFEYLIGATKILISNIQSPISFVVIGEGQERKNLKKLIKKYKLENNFILAGSIDNAARLLSGFDIYVCSSVKEGLSYTLIEAMLSGLPIVATNVGGNPELIVDKKTGLLAKAVDPEDLAQKIKTLIENTSLQQDLSAQARHKAVEEFSLKKMVEKTKEVYKD